jgi:hypothetical protein
MYYVCQIFNNLLGQMDEVETQDEAIDLVLKIVGENGIDISEEVKDEVNETLSYIDEDKEWSVCIGIIG